MASHLFVDKSWEDSNVVIFDSHFEQDESKRTHSHFEDKFLCSLCCETQCRCLLPTDENEEEGEFAEKV